MSRGSILAALAAAGALAVLAPSAAAQETVRLDSSDGTAPYAGPAPTEEALLSDTFYIARARGTVATFDPGVWDVWVNCGVPEPAPLFPPGSFFHPANMDAETIFALPVPTSCGDFEAPVHTGQFEIDTGDGYDHVETRGGPYDEPTPNHAYQYVLLGQDERAAFRLRDEFLEDNVGVLRIRVREAARSDCNQGGWADFGYLSRAECRVLIPAAPA